MGTKHLTEADRLRARTLFFDAGLPKARICQITGFSLNQVKLAIREKTPKTRSGRPPRRRPGASAGAAAVGGVGGSLGIAQGADGPVTIGKHGEDGSQGHSVAIELSSAMGELAAAVAANSERRPDERLSPHHHHAQQYREQQHYHHQDHHHQSHHGHPRVKWEPGYPPQSPYYSSWPPQAPTSPNSMVAGTQGTVTPASPPLPPPTTSIRMLSTVAPQGIPLPSSLMTGRGDGSGSVSSGRGRGSDGHDYSSSMSSSSLASSTTSYSSISSSSGSGGGFSLPSILASATGP